MLRKIAMILLLYIYIPIFSQETTNQTTITNQETVTELLPLKLRGSSPTGGVAIIISNRSPVFNEIRDVITRLTREDFRMALVPPDYDFDVPKLTQKDSPFAPEIKYVVKIHVYTKSISEQLLKTKIEMIRLSDSKYITTDYAVARANVMFFAGQIKRMLGELMPQQSYVNPIIKNVQADQFTFPTKEFPSLRRGDEIKIRYSESRDGLTESIATVQRFSNDFVVAKDLSKKVKQDDVVLRSTPRRNRFYLNIGGIVPTLGETTLIAKSGDNVWQDSPRWPGGFKVEGEYERFLPYNLVSTTSFGINVDRTLHTYLLSGIGYRVFINSLWEVVPYFRIGASYNPLGLRAVSGTGNNLQGFALSLGLSLGINVVRRVGDNLFVGTDVGVQYYPASLISLKSGDDTITPQWKHNNTFTDESSITKLFPYISIKVGWMF